ncbi:MAG: cation-transporting P-type ATPase [Methanothrix sp.]
MKPAKTKTTLDSSQYTSGPAGGKDTEVSKKLQEKSHQDIDIVLKELETSLDGLSQSEADSRLKKYGPNEIAREKRQSGLMHLLDNVKNLLIILLTVLGGISFLTGDTRATVVILLMVLLGVVLRFYQEMRADNAAEKLKAMVSNTATLVRGGKESEVSLKMLVPGNIIRLAACVLVPADVRVLLAKDLFLNQSALAGESLPVEKKAASISEDNPNPLELPNICFMGSNVESGSATAVVVHTGDKTYFGSLAASIVGQRLLTSFDKGINQFTWLMIRFIAVMVPAVFLINGLTKHDWLEAFLFAVAVAVGMTPEMLPMIVTVNHHCCGRSVANGFAPGRCPRFCPAAVAVLAAAGHYAGVLCDSDPGSEDLVYTQVWGLIGLIHSIKKKGVW